MDAEVTTTIFDGKVIYSRPEPTAETSSQYPPPPPPPQYRRSLVGCYSASIAVVGWTDVARHAGTSAARAPQASSVSITAA